MTLLLDEPPVVVQPSLVRRIGILEAAVVQQLHYWSARATREHDGHRWVYKTYDAWADDIGCTAKAARGALDRMRRTGVVVAIANPEDGRDRTLWWRVNHDHPDLRPSGSPSAPAGRWDAPAGSSHLPQRADVARAGDAPQRLLAETTAEIAQVRARRQPLTYRGRRVPPDVAAGAEQLCEVFGTKTGRSCPAYTGDGRPTPEAKQIAGAMMTRPDVPVERWAAAIATTAADPPSWVDGRLMIGHVFGERAAAHALAAAERAASGEPVRPRGRATPQDYLDLIGGTK